MVISKAAKGAERAEANASSAGGNGVIPAFGDEARELARQEAIVEAGDAAAVGEFVDAHGDGERVVTARFAAAVDGYRGWQWSVTVALIDPARPTISEVVLLPGSDALLAPAWVPWEERVRGGDLGVGDLLPPPPDDVRIVPAYLQSDDPAVEELAHELGIGRVRVLSRDGREEAAERWHAGPFGPDDDMAKHAPGTCATCAFFIPLGGSLGAGFGVCANVYSPADGRVVDMAYGCGAHSETTVDRAAASATSDVVIDELALEVHQRADESVADADAAGVVLADADADAADADAAAEVSAEEPS